ncbi:MAG: A/G-specific adenine glycosylase [Lachnospiraceae bacterium]|nr:A/G-specific adenine glycosylase [Lachnospiraceae bacterium]
MRYDNITEGRFISRPNRFIAYVDIGGRVERVHVKNTGRCGELLTEGAQVYLEKSGNPSRSTAYDLVAVKKGERMVNMDSNAPNKAAGEWLAGKELFPSLRMLRAEKTYKNSRFDFYVETEEEKAYLEVKGVTLEHGNRVFFPDAPSERAVKHVEELIEAVKEGYGAYILFVIQMQGVESFSPNKETHPAFAKALEKAAEAGVRILAYDCRVTPDSMEIHSRVPVVLSALDRIPAPLLDWYDRGRRVLPWREDPRPYYVWLSEIMLQQTRVEAVKPYFDRFIRRVPDIETLAGLEEEKLVKLWEGLGYYSRVRNLQKAARMVMEEHGGRLPSAYDDLLKLPGIGSYTAGAVASIAYGQAVPAVDGNVLRVLSRLRMDEGDILSPKTRARIEKELARIMPEDRPGDFNQALMELGATVCLPNGQPRCGECPWESFCEAHQMGREEEFPKKKAKKARTIEEKTVLIIRDEDKAAFCRRPDRGLLAGMYEFPVLEGYRTEEEVLGFLRENGLKVIRIQPIGESKHIFTHREWHMKGYAVRVDELERPQRSAACADWIFIDKEEAREKYPIPSAYGAYTAYLDIKLGV